MRFPVLHLTWSGLVTSLSNFSSIILELKLTKPGHSLRGHIWLFCRMQIGLLSAQLIMHRPVWSLLESQWQDVCSVDISNTHWFRKYSHFWNGFSLGWHKHYTNRSKSLYSFSLLHYGVRMDKNINKIFLFWDGGGFVLLPLLFSCLLGWPLFYSVHL